MVIVGKVKEINESDRMRMKLAKTGRLLVHSELQSKKSLCTLNV